MISDDIMRVWTPTTCLHAATLSAARRLAADLRRRNRDMAVGVYEFTSHEAQRDGTAFVACMEEAIRHYRRCDCIEHDTPRKARRGRA